MKRDISKKDRWSKQKVTYTKLLVTKILSIILIKQFNARSYSNLDWSTKYSNLVFCFLIKIF